MPKRDESVRRASHVRPRNSTNCDRCGLRYTNVGFCPPGFWMTETEIRQWAMQPASYRGEYELALGSELPGETGKGNGT